MARQNRKLHIILWIAFLALLGVIAFAPRSDTGQHPAASPVAIKDESQLTGDAAALARGARQIEAAMQDPDKMRLMECIGINPWKEKPTGWTPPTTGECNAVKRKLDSAAEAKLSSSSKTISPPNDVSLLMAKESTLRDICRGGPGGDPGTQKACDEREAVVTRIKEKNWCWGHGDQIAADRSWEICQ